MLTFTFPFIKTDTRPGRTNVAAKLQPLLPEKIAEARSALLSRDPGRALTIMAPMLSEETPSAEVRLIAGRALSSLERNQEALWHLEAYLQVCPDSVEGLVVAGLTSARVGELGRAINWFNGAVMNLNERQLNYLNMLGPDVHPDPVAIEEMFGDVELDRNNRDRALALACALGRAGHFRIAERFLWVFDMVHEEPRVVEVDISETE
jgi:hypothetical protein